jgi:hypothetical protein
MVLFHVGAKMKKRVILSANHPLRELFNSLVTQHFCDELQLKDRQLVAYVSGVLTEFAHVENLYSIKNAQGRHLQEVGEMLIESNPLLDAPSFDREREVRKHIGDYTLFVTGIFPESLSGATFRRQLSVDSFVDYIKAGKESYAIVSSFDQFEYEEEAPLFKQLSENFELCVFGLNLVKDDLSRLQQDLFS